MTIPRVEKSVLALLAWLFLASAAHARVVEVGQPPPTFALADEHGEIHDLQDMIGKPIILYFTHNMCHYCTQVIRFLKRVHATYGADNLTIVTINVWADGGELIRRYKEAFGLPFSMLAGKNRELLRNYEVNYVPIIVFIDRAGTVRRIDHHYILEHDLIEATKRLVESEE